MIQLSSAGKRFGPKLLFEKLDWLITAHDRVGLVGGNGTGKGQIDEKEKTKVTQNWGNLPEKERAAAMVELTRSMPPRYREAIEAYFKKLSEVK